MRLDIKQHQHFAFAVVPQQQIPVINAVVKNTNGGAILKD